MRVHLRSLLILLALDLLFFHSLVFNPGGILYSDHSDLIAEHIPAKRFLVRSFQETGELPLWCPHLFAGSPFVHDIQVAMFYPPHLMLLLLPEEAVGPALSWLVVLHVLLAGWLMYAYACHRGLPPVPALIAGIGFMFGGRWLMHMLGGGHYILIGLAWLPLVLLGWERVIAGRNWLWGLLAGSAYALLTLSTQPQWTFYSGLFAALWTVGAALEQKQYLRWAACGALVVALTLGLTAIQLLPTLEAARESSRAGGVGAGPILQNGLNVLLFLVGPALSDEPFNLQWEDRGGLSVAWLIVAVWAPILRGGRTRYEAGVCLGLFLFAMGGAVLFQWLPGFSLFRQPARMVVVATLPVAWLGAVTAGILLSQAELTPGQVRACWRWLFRIAIAAVILVGGFSLRLHYEGKPLRSFTMYLLLVQPPLLLCSIWRSRNVEEVSPAARSSLWAAILTMDLFLVAVWLAHTSRTRDTASAPSEVQYIADRRTERGRVHDLDANRGEKSGGAPLGSGAPLALLNGIDAVRGYSPLDVRRYREFLQWIADEDRPMRALDNPFTYPVLSNFELANRSLFDLLGVRYVLSPTEEKPPGGRWRRLASGYGSVYDFLAGGMTPLDLHLWENETPLPRAFPVVNAKPLPERSAILDTFKKTDFREVVYLEDFEEERSQTELGWRTVDIVTYQPNRVVVDVNGASPGFLVLTDVWFPGWKCTLDGEPVKLYRANYTFRAVELPAGAHTVEFRFEPESYRLGQIITKASLAALAAATLVLFVMRRRGRSASTPAAPARESA